VYDALREANELREQLASDKRRIAFLFGAGTSQAVGLPGIVELTSRVPDHLAEPLKAHYNRLLTHLGSNATVEEVLDKVRLCRELLADSTDREAEGLKGAVAVDLERAICRAIFNLVSVDPAGGLAPHVAFAHWVRSIRRDSPVEIFTTNYDVLIERGLELAETPHYDGFVGSVKPYFSGVTVEADTNKAYELVYPPRSWVRVWKLHGSIGWRSEVDSLTQHLKIIRSPLSTPSPTDDLLIFPSRQKYSDSRKLPFVTYQDRLRRLLSSGETFLVTIGYSFRDDHINEILFETLRNNPRLAVAALLFSPLSGADQSRLVAIAQAIRNLSLYGPDQACIAGVLGNWMAPTKTPLPPLAAWPFWDDAVARFKLGDFNAFTEFLRLLFGSREVPTLAAAPPAPVQ
jgi:hypothetical protein